MKCPNCKLENPSDALRCDCGYDFQHKIIKNSYLPNGNIQLLPNKRSFIFILIPVFLAIAFFGLPIKIVIILQIVSVPLLLCFLGLDIQEANRNISLKNKHSIPLIIIGVLFLSWIVYAWWLFKRTKYYKNSRPTAIISTGFFLAFQLSLGLTIAMK